MQPSPTEPTPSNAAAHWPGILLNGFLFISNLGWLALWALITFSIGALSSAFSTRPENLAGIEGFGAVGAVPVLLGVGCALVGAFFAIQGQRARGLWLALGAFVLGSVPGLLLLAALLVMLSQ